MFIIAEMTIKTIKIDINFLNNIFQFLSSPNEDFHIKQSMMTMMKKYFYEYWVKCFELIILIVFGYRSSHFKS